MSSSWEYDQDQELPSWAGRWLNGAGVPIDFSEPGYTYSAKLVDISTQAVGLSKTTGITGGNGTTPLTVDPNETPGANIAVAWAPGDLNITPGTYRLHLSASNASGDRKWQAPTRIIIKAAV